MEKINRLSSRRMPAWMVAIVFTGLWVALLALMAVRADAELESAPVVQQVVYAMGSSLLLAVAGTLSVMALYSDSGHARSWVYPVAAAGVSLVLYVVAYVFMGVWPIGEKSVMAVDMHHQYAPLLSDLRDMFRTGEGFIYSFHMGLGGNFLPTFAYYLASPLNLLLLLFPEHLLTEGIFVITLLKGAASAAAFAACAQYVTRHRSAATVAFAVLYSLTGYMLAYSWNIMWLDVVALLPVVVLCMERMLRQGGIVPYALVLALALFVNYYIGFMLCIFLVLYMLVWLLRESRTGREVLQGCVRFGVSSLLAGGLAAALLIPTALALGRTSAAGGELPDFNSNFPLFDLIGRLFYGASPTIRSGNLPNLYCGVPALLLLPQYLGHRDIPMRRRLCFGGLLAVLLVSCTVNQADLLWHGLHAPNDLPYRFSFLVCFVLLLMAADLMANPTPASPRLVVASLVGCAAYLVVWERLDSESAIPATALYMNLLLLVLYGAVLLAGATRRAPRQMTARLLLTVVCLELSIGAGETLRTIDKNEVFTYHYNYVDNSKTTVTAEAVKQAQQLGLQELGEDFFRLEYLPRDTCMDPALHHYAGFTTFASSNPYQTTLLMGELGYAINGVNSYLYHSFVPAVDSLFGMRYVILANNITGHAQLEQVMKVEAAGETRYIYRNNLALPLAYMADGDVTDYRGTKYHPFDSQEALYSALTGEWVTLYHQLSLEGTTAGANVSGNTSFNIPGGADEEEFYAPVEETGQYFAYVDCGAADEITVLTYDENGGPLNSWSVNPREPYIIDMGTLKEGQSVQTWVESDSYASGNIYLVRLDAEALTTQLDTLRQGGLTVTERTETTITGTVTAKENQKLVITVPYDKGWTVEVDGVAVETYPLATYETNTTTTEGEDETAPKDGALLCAAVPAGTHTVKMIYRVPGLKVGLLVSLVSLLALVGIGVGGNLLRRRKPVPAPAFDLPDEEEELTFVPMNDPAPLPDTLEELMVEPFYPVAKSEESELPAEPESSAESTPLEGPILPEEPEISDTLEM